MSPETVMTMPTATHALRPTHRPLHIARAECDCPHCGSSSTRSLPVVYDRDTGRWCSVAKERDCAGPVLTLALLLLACIVGGGAAAYVCIAAILLAVVINANAQRARTDTDGRCAPIHRCRRCGWTFMVDGAARPAHALAAPCVRTER
jgi:hypothetical protein